MLQQELGDIGDNTGFINIIVYNDIAFRLEFNEKLVYLSPKTVPPIMRFVVSLSSSMRIRLV